MFRDKIEIARSSMPKLEEYIEEIKELWDSHWLTNMGQKHNELEQKLIMFLCVSNISLFTNGHLALELAIDALNLTGEVITTPFTFASTTQAIVRNRLTPVFCDINKEDYTIDVNKIEELITEKTSAIIPVHVYGNVCDVYAIDKIAKKYNLKVIYDAAHVFGVKVNGIGIGNFGDMSMFSFHATKVFHTVEGGGVTYGESRYSDIFARLRQFGMKGKEDVLDIGTNAKMTEMHAAMGLCNLRHIDEELAKRKAIVNRYRERLRDKGGIILCKPQENISPNYAYFPVFFDKRLFGKNRDEIDELLANNDIYARKYFYPLTSSFEVYKGMFDIQETPIAEQVSNNILTLPLYADLSLEDVDRICDIILGQEY